MVMHVLIQAGDIKSKHKELMNETDSISHFHVQLKVYKDI